MKKTLKFLINLTLICTLIYSGYNIYSKLSEYKKADNIYNDIRDSVPNENKHSTLTKVNTDYRLWLNIENTNIDYPVVQGIDNDFYLTHDFNKNPLASGSIFMDYKNDFDKDKSIIIYGHHMKNKTMFQELANFKDENFFKNNNIISIEHKDKTYTYEVFSTYVADLSKDYLKTHFENDDEYTDYLNYILRRSLFSSDIKLTSKDKIITLYTCSYEFKDARTIVHAKLISVE